MEAKALVCNVEPGRRGENVVPPPRTQSSQRKAI